mgnify:FL=1
MKNEFRTQDQVIKDIRTLVASPGYIITLCMILFEDFHLHLEEIERLNTWERLSTKEIAFLMGLFLQNKEIIIKPDNPENLIRYKTNTYQLFNELHLSYAIPFRDKMAALVANSHNGHNVVETSRRADLKDFFGDAQLIKETITYSGAGAYDVQFLDFLDRKYKYDKDWLFTNKRFEFNEIRNIAQRIKDILSEKSQKVYFLALKENLDSMIQKLKKKSKGRFDETKFREQGLMPMEFYQYRDLFGPIKLDSDPAEMDRLREANWESFYDGILDLFVINKSKFKDYPNADAFFENFSFIPDKDNTVSVNTMEDYNILTSKPIIKLDEDRYFVPTSYLVFESIYESPYYWMFNDKSYRDQLGTNRGKASEEIVFDFLTKVFGERNTYKSIIVSSKKGDTDTDIDVLCVLGNKALCVQVKSKKLTRLARAGNTEQLLKDFKGAVQDAYNQGLVCRNKIIDKSARFFDATGKEIKFADQINDVYIMGVTSENYPSLTHQSYVLLNKCESDPDPIFLTIFDLQLLVHYLSDPYDFLYYIRQRISLIDKFKADEEINYLSYHLTHKLSNRPEADYIGLANDTGLLIDKNYYCYIYGLKDRDADKDRIRNSWINSDFQKLCDALKEFRHPQITDIIFDIFDWPEETRDQVIKMIKAKKQETLIDHKNHNFSFIINSTNSGFTYVSHKSNFPRLLQKDLTGLTTARKYKHKLNKWIGLGSLYSSSDDRIDLAVYHNYAWFNDPVMEKTSNEVLEASGVMTTSSGHKIGRNDPCPCNSGKKYKKCCGAAK